MVDFDGYWAVGTSQMPNNLSKQNLVISKVQFECCLENG